MHDQRKKNEKKWIVALLIRKLIGRGKNVSKMSLIVLNWWQEFRLFVIGLRKCVSIKEDKEM